MNVVIKKEVEIKKEDKVEIKKEVERPKIKKKSRKRLERDNVYMDMPFRDLQRLLKERGLQKATRRSTAIILLESSDNGVDLSIPKIEKPKKFQPLIKPLDPTTLYSDITKPFYGVSMTVLDKYVFSRLNYLDKLALARTCRDFYSPLMKNICATFHRFLIKFYQTLQFKRSEDANYSFLGQISLSSDAYNIITQGVGITPLAVAYAYKHGIPDPVDETGRLHRDTSKIEKLIKLIYKNGTLDRYVATKRAKKLQMEKWIIAINERLKILNQTVVNLKSYNCGDKLFSIEKNTSIKIYCNWKTFNKPQGRPSTDFQYATKAFYNYILEGVEFDWNLLSKYLNDIANIYELVKEESFEIKLENQLLAIIPKDELIKILSRYKCYICSSSEYCILHN